MAEQSFIARRRTRSGRGWLERMTGELFAAFEHSLRAEATTKQAGLLQPLDPRVKLLGLLALAVAAVGTRSLAVVYALLLTGALLTVVSRVSMRTMARLWLSVLVFTGVLALPALFVVRGEAIGRLPGVGWTITLQGLSSAAFMVGRALAAASFMILLILTTPWPHLLKAMRRLHVPAVAVALLGMTYRYIFVLLKSALALFDARRSRMLARIDGRTARRLAITSLGVLLSRSITLGNEVYLAMLARGYRGRNASLDTFAMAARDWIALAGFAAVTALALGLGGSGHG
jgi:cobalt/nickel transport system permease protein